MASEGDVRIRYQHQVGYDDEYVETVASIADAKKKLETVCKVMLFLEEYDFIPDYANLSFIEVFNGEHWEEHTEED